MALVVLVVLILIQSTYGIMWNPAGFLLETAGLPTKSARFPITFSELPNITTLFCTYSAE
ncbi:hypothetical protein U9J35_15075 [Rossellomorea aquimaris]|nr:hypothetical protein [Rossellomorea aquimaris]WRP05234.1 hypothetical protein U9J35_15075 [Rossellomorea aquimaris]